MPLGSIKQLALAERLRLWVNDVYWRSISRDQAFKMGFKSTPDRQPAKTVPFGLLIAASFFGLLIFGIARPDHLWKYVLALFAGIMVGRLIRSKNMAPRNFPNFPDPKNCQEIVDRGLHEAKATLPDPLSRGETNALTYLLNLWESWDQVTPNEPINEAIEHALELPRLASWRPLLLARETLSGNDAS